MHSILIQLLIFSSASIILVPLFKWLKLGPILAYLFAGMLIGPSTLALIKDPDVILHFSELGVVFLLFIIGLELAPARLWKLRKSIFGMGLLQVLVTGTIFLLIGISFGQPLHIAYIAGFGLALSSTAFSIQILQENRQVKTMHGQGSFSILMFQDIAVVPLLASLAFFAIDGGSSSGFNWLSLFKAVGVVALVIFIGRFFIRRVFSWVAGTGIQEVFTAMSLLVVLGTGLLLESVGLSMGLGAFIAGVLLANSEYRHELESNLLPFKGLLLGLFFIAVGMSLKLDVLAAKPFLIISLGVGFMFVKGLVIFGLGRVFGYPVETARNMAFTLPQGGEFAFVLFSTALAQNLMTTELQSILNAAVTLSMVLTPFVFRFNQKLLRSFSEISERPYDQIDNVDSEAIVAGYGRFGQIVSRYLQSQGVKYTILEHSAAQVDTARKYGEKIFYGDASKYDILLRAHAGDAKYFILAIDDPLKSIETAKMVRDKFPNLMMFARARNRQHALDLMELGVDKIYRETFLTSLELAKEIMLTRGVKEQQIDLQLKKFIEHDKNILKKQFKLRGNEKEFINFTTQANKELEDLLRADEEGLSN